MSELHEDILGATYVDEHDSGDLVMRVIAPDGFSDQSVIVQPVQMPVRSWWRAVGQVRALITEYRAKHPAMRFWRLNDRSAYAVYTNPIYHLHITVTQSTHWLNWFAYEVYRRGRLVESDSVRLDGCFLSRLMIALVVKHKHATEALT